MGTIANLTTNANQIAKLLDLAVEPLNEKLKETGYQVIFRQVWRAREILTLSFLYHEGWRSEITLHDADLPKLMAMNPDDIVSYLKFRDDDGDY